jgi:hypothetical protein
MITAAKGSTIVRTRIPNRWHDKMEKEADYRGVCKSVILVDIVREYYERKDAQKPREVEA